MGMPDALGPAEDDGLPTPPIKSYARGKHSLLLGYAELFSSSMKKKWTHRVYVDLFAGAGKAMDVDAGRVVLTSPLLALSVKEPFTHYVFCEQDAECLDALRSRVLRYKPGSDCCFLLGNTNEMVDQVLDALPALRRGESSLGFCFADPWGMSNLDFATVEKLSTRYMDFLVLVPTEMQFARFCRGYETSDRDPVAGFTGVPDWRARLEDARRAGDAPEKLLLDLYDERMLSLGYEHGGREHAVPIRLPSNRRILYHLVFYSRNALGREFFAQARKYSIPQQELF